MSRAYDRLIAGGDIDDILDFVDMYPDYPTFEDEDIEWDDEQDDCRKEKDAIHCWDCPGDGYAYDPGYDADDELPL